MRDTSLEAYEIAKERLNEKQQAVYDFILSRGEVCDKQISEGLGWPINRVTPRRGELLTLEKIVDLGVRKHDLRSVHFWKVKLDSPKQLGLFAA